MNNLNQNINVGKSYLLQHLLYDKSIHLNLTSHSDKYRSKYPSQYKTHVECIMWLFVHVRCLECEEQLEINLTVREVSDNQDIAIDLLLYSGHYCYTTSKYQMSTVLYTSCMNNLSYFKRLTNLSQVPTTAV